jgi:sRNA-binding carbon storage regulator CsrA
VLWLNRRVGESIRIETPAGTVPVTVLDIPANDKVTLEIDKAGRVALRIPRLHKPVLVQFAEGVIRIEVKELVWHSRVSLGFDAPKDWPISHERRSQSPTPTQSAELTPSPRRRPSGASLTGVGH